MAQCPIEIPQCKRKLMTSNEPFERKQCPLNVKPRCSLLQPACPLLPQREDVCGLSKLQNPDTTVSVSQCPCKSPCLLAPPGCPVTMKNISRENDANKEKKEFPEYMPPCPKENCNYKNNKIKKPKKTNYDKSTVNIGPGSLKTDSEGKSKQDSNKCPVGSSRRPLPCAECLLDELSRNAAGDNADKLKACPFLKIADMCGPFCKCEEVPEINSGPRCPYLPKPCPCCVTPRCPMSKQPDCAIKPKPFCKAVCQDIPPCVCGKNCLGQTVPMPSCVPSSNLNPPRCLCGGCPSGSPCPFTAPKCVCGYCPLLFPCCPPKPCSCLCGMCPIGKILCSVAPSCQIIPCSPCPLIPPSCPLTSAPSCPLKLPPCCPKSGPPCPLVVDPCPLLKKPICPPIPTPCSINKYELQPIPPKTTFHVPICPEYKPPCKIHLTSPNSSNLICPFSPHPCPLGSTCPFPIVNPKSTIIKTLPKQQTDQNILPKQNECPGSSGCGALPHPECPAAEILYPEKFKKKVKPKKDPCPLKGCMRKPECPLNKAMPNVDCPMAEDSDCPMSKEPDCPIVELASRCPLTSKCPALPPPQCPFENEPRKIVGASKIPNSNSNENSKDCPLSNLPECLKGIITPKPSCPLLPTINCPLAPKPECPLAPAPGCPLAEFAPKPNCPMVSATCPLTSSNKCPLTPTPECPITPTPKCPLTPTPKCPLTPTPKCPLTPTPKCPLTPTPKCPLTPTPKCPLTPTPKCPLTPTPKCPLAPAPKCPLSSTQLQGTSECILSQLSQIKTKGKFNNTTLDGTTTGKTKNNVFKQLSEELSTDCPLEKFIPKRTCPLAPPPCPLTPKPKCPLTKKPDPCPLSLNKRYCPVEYPTCRKFPDGRCPMEKLNVCDCEYPVAPCLINLKNEDVLAPSQYCLKENCCMGLGLPPANKMAINGEGIQSDDGNFYLFQDTKPGKEETKHYVQIMTEPPNLTIGLIGVPRKRLHNSWDIIKYGEGYKRCKTIAQKLEEMGPIDNKSTQYFSDDCHLAPEALALLESKKAHKRDMLEINILKQQLGLSG